MSGSLLDLSEKIEPILLEIFDVIAGVATERNVHYFVVGATARDLILYYGYGIQIQRATADIDLGVEVANWEEFRALLDGLVNTGKFTKTKSEQKVLYKGNLPLDIIPFGPLESANREISWPPDSDYRMNVLGFEDAYQGAQKIRLKSDPVLDVPFVTAAGLAILKVIAWNDRFLEDNRDASDLAFLMRNYIDAGNRGRLTEQHSDLLDVNNFDYEHASARLLGRDMAIVMSSETKRVVLEILGRETNKPEQYRLVEHLTRGSGRRFGECLQLLESLKVGIEEVDLTDR